jgi:hypothetical protein
MGTAIIIPPTGDASSIGDANGQSDVELARALVERLSATGQRSIAETLHQLRQAFPNSPLSVRVAALELLHRGETRYIPR